MRISIIAEQNLKNSQTIFVPLFQKKPLAQEDFFSLLPAEFKDIAGDIQKNFSGEEGEIKSFWIAGQNPKQFAFFGLGKEEKWNSRKAQLLPRRMVRYAKNEKIKEFATTMCQTKLGTITSLVWHMSIFAANAEMANFEFNEYKEKPKGGWSEVKNIYLATEGKDLKKNREGLQEGLIIGEETNACRKLANTPGGDITPKILAEKAVAVAGKNKIAVRILDEKEIQKIGMGGLYGVSRGSDEKPRFIIMEYRRGPKGQKPLVLAGKGVTFDTGGLNLKPDQAIYQMHMDMSGGAAVIHGLAAIARLKLPINVMGLIPAVENATSGSSYRPGDILKSLSGKTVEVLNTDAEGRIILADALTYALRYKPGLILDLATLTGAAHVALGNYCSALFTNKEKLQEKLMAIGEQSGDYVWPLPLWDEYLEEIKGNFGDLANISVKQDRWGGAIHGAKFLEQFVDDTPWAHLDIAPRMTTNEYDLLAKGASGVGVRYIVEIAKQFPKFLMSTS